MGKKSRKKLIITDVKQCLVFINKVQIVLKNCNLFLISQIICILCCVYKSSLFFKLKVKYGQTANDYNI